MSGYGNRYDDSPDSWPIRSSCGGGCGGGMSRMGVSQMPQRWDESWQPDYVPRASATPRMPMSRFYPDEQPDAVSLVFSRAGVERPVPLRYDDSPDSPNFYAPRIPQVMQPPGMGMQRSWDDGPDSPNFYGQPVPQTMQPPGIQRPWDDGPDSPNFYGQPVPQTVQSLGVQMQQRPWDDGPDTDNFYRRQSPSSVMQQVLRDKPWDDGPDTDNFYWEKQIRRNTTWEDYLGNQDAMSALWLNSFKNNVMSPSEFFSYENNQELMNRFRILSKEKGIFGSGKYVQNVSPNSLPDDSFPILNSYRTQPNVINGAYPIDSWEPTATPPDIDIRRSAARTFLLGRKWRSTGYYWEPLRYNWPLPSAMNVYLQRIYNIWWNHSRAHHQQYRNAARYGRSVARMETECYKGYCGGRCSSSAISGHAMMTAAHCRVPEAESCVQSAYQVNAIPERRFQFGLFAPENIIFANWGKRGELLSEAKTLGTSYLLDRLQSLGLSFGELYETRSSVAFDPLQNFFVFKGNLLRTDQSREYNCRDIDYYGFKPTYFDQHLPVINKKGTFTKDLEQVLIYPSHLWGYIPIMSKEERNWPIGSYQSVGKIRPGRSVYLLQVNQAEMYDHMAQVLLSHSGQITFPLFPLPEEFFVGGTYWEPGSSGGVILDEQSNSAMGVLSGTRLINQMLTSVISPEANKIIDEYENASSKTIYVKSLTKISSKTSTAGLVQGYTHELICPNNYIAAGFIGSSVFEQKSIGNLGLVCLPFSYGYLFDQAKVITAGSVDTEGFIPQFAHRPEPFEKYWNDRWVRDYYGGYTAFNDIYPQHFSMCPPYFYLTGLFIGDNKNIYPHLKGILGVRCEHYLGHKSFAFLPATGLGKIGIPLTVDGFKNIQNIHYLQCPQNQYVDGMVVTRTNHTNSIQLRCRTVK